MPRAPLAAARAAPAMPQDLDRTHDAPLRPPVEAATAAFWRWLLAGLLVLVIVAGAWHAYRWLVTDVERRRAVAGAPAVASPPPASPVAAAGGAAPPGERTPAPPAARASEPAPPAVAGAIHKCVVDGQVSYSNQPCPDGAQSAPQPPELAGSDVNGVAGSAGDHVPAVLVARPASLDVGDPGQHSALCGYLTAELERLDFEFRQPLPPAVLDHISSQLAGLRAQHAGAGCAPLPKAAGAAPASTPTRKRPPTRLVEERGDD